MNKLLLTTAIAAALGAGMSTSANATSLTGASNLGINAGVVTSNAYGSVFFVKSGSYFGMDTNGKGGIKASERTAIAGNNGLSLSSTGTQPASGSHLGAPGCASDSAGQTDPALITCTNGDNGPESPNVDAAWNFFGNTGFHTAGSTGLVNNTAASTATIDMSTWGVTWSGIPFINMGSGGTATITCTSGTFTCQDTETYTLDYNAAVPAGDPSGFGGVAYALHLEGVVTTASAVPVPAAAWLFGSGLLGLVGVARRRKVA